MPSLENKVPREDHWRPDERKTYESLCRGEGGHPELHCFYYTGQTDNYYLKLGPVKAELLFESPYVVRFYNVYSEYEMEYVKNKAYNQLNRATVFDPATHKLVNAGKTRLDWNSHSVIPLRL